MPNIQTATPDRDINPFVAEPTKDSPTFTQEPLTKADHLDPDWHWIGEGLPAAGQAELGISGIQDYVGTSAFTARADHEHDSATIWSTYGQFGTQTAVPGQTFLNGFLHNGGRDILAPASTQIFIPPTPGMWKTELQISVERDGGGAFTGECNIVYFFNNGTSNLMVWRDSMVGIPDTRTIDTFFPAFGILATDPTINIQFAIQHNDVANYFVTIDYLKITRDHGPFSI
jgi:hypothetical protein